MRALCEQTLLLSMNPRLRKLASLSGLLSGEALGLPYYRVRAMQDWVDQTIERESIDTVVVFSSTMAQYVQGDRYRHLNRIIDFVDVDSDKWAQYAARASGPTAWVYRREAAALLRFERRIAATMDASLFVTQAEADLFRRLPARPASDVGAHLPKPCPPFTWMICAVTQIAMSEARNITTFATSSGVPSRPAGMELRMEL